MIVLRMGSVSDARNAHQQRKQWDSLKINETRLTIKQKDDDIWTRKSVAINEIRRNNRIIE